MWTPYRAHIAELRADLDPVQHWPRYAAHNEHLLADAVDNASIAASRSEAIVPLDSFFAGLRTA